MSDMGGNGDRLSRLAVGHRTSGAQRPLLPGSAAAPSPPKRAGVMGCAAMRQRAVHDSAGTNTALGLPATHRTQQRPQAPGWREPPRGVDGPHRRGLCASAPGPQGGRGPTRETARNAPGQNACAGAAGTGTLTMDVRRAACCYGLPSNRPHAAGAKWAQDITGVVSNPKGAQRWRTKRSFSVATAPLADDSPLC